MPETTLASVVTLPDLELQPSESPAHCGGAKRSIEVDPEQNQDQVNKRRRTSRSKSPPSVNTVKSAVPEEKESAEPVPDAKSEVPIPQRRKRSIVIDEKQRSKRLFGALLGNLNQPANRTSKKRQEIESRKKAELERQDDERLEDKQRRLERLTAKRRVAQRKVDEANMRIRHAHLLDRANFLQTKSEPRLFYQPWQLRPAEEDEIAQQINNAEDQIAREEDEFYGTKSDVNMTDTKMTGEADQANEQQPSTEEKNLDEKPGLSCTAQTKPDQIERERDKLEAEDATKIDEENSDKPMEDSETPTTLQDQEKQAAEDDEGDHVVQSGEDTLIY